MAKTIPKQTETMTKILSSLDELKMEAAKQTLQKLVEEATKRGVEFLEGLGALLLAEVGHRRERRVNRRIKEARFPEIKTLDTYDFTFPKSINDAQIWALTELAFILEASNVIITGKSGTGKSHIGLSLGLLACGHDFRVRYTTCVAMLRDLFASLADQSLERRLRRYIGPDLLIIDDLGTEKIEIIHGQGAALFFKVINKRHGIKSTIITSNIDAEAWPAHFGDPNVTVAALDRFIQHAIPVVIDGPSYRAKIMEERMAAAEARQKKEKKRKRKTTKRK